MPMSIDEYRNRKTALNAEHEKAQKDLAMLFVNENNIYCKGDMITDHIGTISIETISAGNDFGSGVPVPVYFGACYTKAGKPFKSGEKRSVWGPNLKESK